MAFPPLRIEITQQDNVVIFRPSGWVAADGHVPMEEKLHALFADGHRRVIIDLSRAHFVSSTGLGIFLYFKQVLEDAGGRLVLASPGGAVSKMLAASNLDQALTICPSLAEAVVRIQKRISSKRRRTGPA